MGFLCDLYIFSTFGYFSVTDKQCSAYIYSYGILSVCVLVHKETSQNIRAFPRRYLFLLVSNLCRTIPLTDLSNWICICEMFNKSNWHHSHLQSVMKENCAWSESPWHFAPFIVTVGYKNSLLQIYEQKCRVSSFNLDGRGKNGQNICEKVYH